MLAEYRCTRCGHGRDLEVHHKTYERLGHEWDQDLEVLCSDCHHGHHLEQAMAQPIGVYVLLAMTAYESEPFDSIASLAADVKARCVVLKIPNDERQIDKALNLVTRRMEFVREQKPVRVLQEQELAQSAPPCHCQACRKAGVSERRLHRDIDSGEWMHGETLKRWHAARDDFRARARGAVGKPGRHALGFEPLASAGE